MTTREDSSRDGTTCAGPGCRQTIERKSTGRPARYCSGACRMAAHRLSQQFRDPITVEVDFGSASSRGRRADKSWMVRIRRGQISDIVAVGLTRQAADAMAERISRVVS